jgi:hypothetical protein
MSDTGFIEKFANLDEPHPKVKGQSLNLGMQVNF